MKPLTNLEKRKATMEARNAAFARQTVTIDADWKIVRADEKNWEIQFKDDFKGYYGSLISAFNALPAKMLSAQARGDLRQILETHDKILKTIEQALSRK